MILKKILFTLLAITIGLTIPCSAGEIHKAAKNGDMETVKQLIEKDAKLLNAGNRLEQTPLMMAAYGGHAELVQWLIDKGAGINHSDLFGATPLHMAVDSDHKEVTQLLIDKGAEINARSKNGKVPLQIAFENDNADIAALFLDRGIQLNASIDQYQRTLLHKAAIMGKPGVTQLLVERGAALDAKDSTGKTALDLALICGHKSLAALLIKKGAKPLDVPPLEVTYIANAGFSIACGEHKVVVDGLFRDGFGKYAVPSAEMMENIGKSQPPFDGVNLVLVTFNQGAHFDRGLTESFLVTNPGAILLSPRQVGLEFELYGSQFSKIKSQLLSVTPSLNAVAEVVVDGIRIRVPRLNYMDGVEHVGYILDLGGKVLCFLGDGLLKRNQGILKRMGLRESGVDVLFLPHWDFLNPESRAVMDKFVKPVHIVVTHIPVAEAGAIYKDIEALKKDYPQVIVFKELLEKKIF